MCQPWALVGFDAVLVQKRGSVAGGGGEEGLRGPFHLGYLFEICATLKRCDVATLLSIVHGLGWT